MNRTILGGKRLSLGNAFVAQHGRAHTSGITVLGKRSRTTRLKAGETANKQAYHCKSLPYRVERFVAALFWVQIPARAWL